MVVMNQRKLIVHPIYIVRIRRPRADDIGYHLALGALQSLSMPNENQRGKRHHRKAEHTL